MMVRSLLHDRRQRPLRAKRGKAPIAAQGSRVQAKGIEGSDAQGQGEHGEQAMLLLRTLTAHDLQACQGQLLHRPGCHHRRRIGKASPVWASTNCAWSW